MATPNWTPKATGRGQPPTPDSITRRPSPGLSSSQSSENADSISSVSLKLPPYWPADPQIWFVQVEAMFATRGIRAQTTKYQHVIASLTHDLALEIRDVLLNPPTQNQYDYLKETLIKRTRVSEQQRLKQLLYDEQLGDRRPSELLRCMQQHLGAHASDASLNALLRELFLQRLPVSVRLVVASTKSEQSLDDVAEMADRMMEVAAAQSQPIAAVTDSPALRKIEEQVAALTAAFTEFKGDRGRSRIQSSSGSSSRASSSRVSPSRGSSTGPCFYHRKFGKQARNCRSPCSCNPNA